MATFTAGQGTTGFESTGYLSEEVKTAAEEAYEKTGRMIDDHVEKMRKATESMGKMHEEVTKMAAGMLEDLFTKEWRKLWLKLGEDTTRIVSEAVSRGMRMSMSTQMIADVKPGLGDAGVEIGKSLGKAVGMAMGAELGPIGMQLAGQLGSAIGGVTFGAAQMQLEGYRMMGARAAPTAYAGQGRADMDFEKMGREYRAAILDITVSTGASADQVEKLAQALSRLGVGFLEGGKEEASFALAAERAMNLQAGTVEKLDTKAVQQYGESITIMRGQMNLVNMEMLKMTQLERDQGNTIAATYKSGTILIDTLGQIESGTKNTSVSMESMNMIGVSLVDVMTKAGNVRPGAITQTATHLTSAFLPQGGKDFADEARKSALIPLLLNRTALGQSQYARELEEQKKYPGLGLASTGEMASSGSKEFAADHFFAMLAGAADLSKERGMPVAAATIEATTGVKLSPVDMQRAVELFGRLQKEGVTGYMSDEDAVKRAEGDDQFKKDWAAWKDLQKRAAEQGDAQMSELTKIGNLLTQISIWTNEQSESVADKFSHWYGLSKKGEHPGWWKTFADLVTGAPRVKEEPPTPPAPAGGGQGQGGGGEPAVETGTHVDNVADAHTNAANARASARGSGGQHAGSPN